MTELIDKLMFDGCTRKNNQKRLVSSTSGILSVLSDVVTPEFKFLRIILFLKIITKFYSLRAKLPIFLS